MGRGRDEVRLRLRRGLARHARPARRQGRERRRDDARARAPSACPPGFTITTEACVAYMTRTAASPRASTSRSPRRSRGWRSRPARRSATPTTRCSCRCARGARESMPGCSTRSSTSASTTSPSRASRRTTGNERFAWDSYRRFVQMFGNVVPRRRRASDRGRDQGAEGRAPASSDDTELDVDDLQALVDAVQGALPRRDRRGLPAGPAGAARARRSAPCSTPGSASARSSYRRINRIPDDWGTAVNVQQMVFGNKGDTLVLGRRVQPRRGDRRARAVGRLPRQRPGRGRRLRRAHAARHRRAEGRRCPRPTTS